MLGHDVIGGVAILTLLEAPVRVIAEGDTFTICAGCDKRIETCGAKFANTANFRGFPHIPGQDAVVRYASQNSVHEERCCESGRSGEGGGDGARLARHPLPRPGEREGVGCDCLGLARGVWREVVGPEPMPIQLYSRDWGETRPREVLADGARRMMIEVKPADAGPGALVLFRMLPRAIAKHVGILSGPDRFVHAYERLGVVEETLTQGWRWRIAFAFLFPR